MKIELKYKVLFVLIIIFLLVFFIVIKPYFSFKNMEKELLESGKRYYEINNTKLPTGKRIEYVYLKELYLKDFIESDLKKKINSKNCNVDTSFIRVYKENNEYKYDDYLECKWHKSKIDHEGPSIVLNGKEEITIYKDEKYKELGVSSVVDDTDGKLNVKDVEIDSSKVKTSKVGTYEVTYRIKDSLKNETIKKRKVNVIETLTHVVKKQTKNTGIYTGEQSKNYILLDGILFRIVGMNSDKTIKLVTDTTISAINYDSAEEWLNKVFYEKLSDSAKKYIVKDSKWCIDNVLDPSNYNKCNKYTNKNPIGLLSIMDYNNSLEEIGEEKVSFIPSTLLYNLKTRTTGYISKGSNYERINPNDNIPIAPAVNIVKNATIVSGNGTSDNPYRLKGNRKSLKAGDKINNARVGDYIQYSGYTWRVIEKEDDETTKIIMDGVIITEEGNSYDLGFTNKSSINFNIKEKDSLAYALANEASKYVRTNLLVSKERDYPKYSKEIKYNADKKTNEYKLKLNIPSMYEVFSTSVNISNYWYKEYMNDIYCYYSYVNSLTCKEYDNDDFYGIRVVTNLSKNVTINSGKGISNNPYTLSK